MRFPHAWSLVTSGRCEFEGTAPFVAGIQLKEQLILVEEGLVSLTVIVKLSRSSRLGTLALAASTVLLQCCCVWSADTLSYRSACNPTCVSRSGVRLVYIVCTIARHTYNNTILLESTWLLLFFDLCLFSIQDYCLFIVRCMCAMKSQQWLALCWSVIYLLGSEMSTDAADASGEWDKCYKCSILICVHARLCAMCATSSLLYALFSI